MLKRTLTITVYLLQAVLAYCTYALLRLVPLDAASAACGYAAEKIGPLLSFDRVARANLAMVFPDKSEEERKRIRLGMWNNLGRLIAEYVHINSFLGCNSGRITLVNEHMLDDLKECGTGALVISGHFANWEMANITANNNGLPLNLIYRPPNNFFVEPLYRLRQRKSHGELIPKGRYAAKRILQLLKEKKYVGIMVDQKMNSGISVEFLGHPAMTLDSVATFALMRRCPILPARVKRTEGSHFETILYPPIQVEDTGNHNADISAVMARINTLLGEWVMDAPEQWLWIHDRWGLKRKGIL